MIGALGRKRIFIAKLVNLCAVVALVACYGIWSQQAAAADAAAKQQEQQAARAGEGSGPYTQDGTFTGEAQGYGGLITMQVTIEGGYITDVQVVSAPGEDSAYLGRAESLIPSIIDQQTSNVDTVSGCTYSSTGIINATTAALKQSLGGGA